MNRSFLILILFLLSLGFATQAQQVVWQKTYSWKYDDQLFAIKKADNGYVAWGTRESKGIFYRSYTYSEVCWVRITEQGDTLPIKSLNTWRASGSVSASLEKCPDGNYLVALQAGDTALGWSFAVRLIKVSPEGDVIWLVDYPNTRSWNVNSLCATPDGGALIVGSKFSQTGGLGEGFAIRVNSEGVPLWTTLLNTYFQTYPYHVELQNKAGNSFLVSGAAGSAIWAAWLDTAGNVTKERVFWHSSSGLTTACVLQSPDGKLVATGSVGGSGSVWYLGKYDTSGVYVWGASYSGACTSPYVNTQGQILLESYNPAIGFSFSKYNSDGSVAGYALLSSDISHQKAIYCAAWSDNDSAVFAGAISTDRNNYRTDFYFVKMAQVGNPYITAVPALVAEKQPIALYPNPASSYFKISSASPGIITLFNAAGQNVLQQSVQPLEHVAISGLPQGLYMYRFVTAKGVSSGKVVRE